MSGPCVCTCVYVGPAEHCRIQFRCVCEISVSVCMYVCVCVCLCVCVCPFVCVCFDFLCVDVHTTLPVIARRFGVCGDWLNARVCLFFRAELCVWVGACPSLSVSVPLCVWLCALGEWRLELNKATSESSRDAPRTFRT